MDKIFENVLFMQINDDDDQFKGKRTIGIVLRN